MKTLFGRSEFLGRKPLWVPALAALGLLCHLGTAQASATQRACSAEPTDDLVVYGDLVTCDINPGSDTDNFRFAGAVGETVIIQIASLDATPADPCLELFRPDGTALVANTCPPAAPHSTRLVAALDQSGEYSIRVTEQGADNVLMYSLVLDRVGAPVSPAATLLDPGVSLEGPDVQISPVGEIDFFAFQGEAGDSITVTVTDVDATASVPQLEIRGPDGAFIATCCNNNGVVHSLSRNLTESGIYSVVVWERSNGAPLSYRLEYSCSGVCPSLVLKRRYIDTASIEDIGGSGAPEAVALFQSRSNKVTRLLVKDGNTRATIKTIKVFGNAIEPLALASVGDQTGDFVSELAVLGVNLNTGKIAVWLVDPVLETVGAPKTYFGSGYAALGITRIEDLDGDTRPEVGVMALDKATNTSVLKVKEALTWGALKTIKFPK